MNEMPFDNPEDVVIMILLLFWYDQNDSGQSRRCTHDGVKYRHVRVSNMRFHLNATNYFRSISINTVMQPD
jgi:hypothetical protein